MEWPLGWMNRTTGVNGFLVNRQLGNIGGVCWKWKGEWHAWMFCKVNGRRYLGGGF